MNFPSAAAANDTYLAMMRKAMLAKKSITVALDRLEANLGDPRRRRRRASRGRCSNDAAADRLLERARRSSSSWTASPPGARVPDTDLERVINTSPIVLKDKTGELYLHLFDGWMRAASLQGPWTVADPNFAARHRSRRRSSRSSTRRPATR